MEALLQHIFDAINAVVLFISDLNNGIAAGIRFLVGDVPDFLNGILNILTVGGVPIFIVAGIYITIIIFVLRFILMK